MKGAMNKFLMVLASAVALTGATLTQAHPVGGPKGGSGRVLAYDTREEKLIRVSIPFWLLRLAPSRHVSFLSDTGINFDSDRVRLTLDDLERRGPGLILDQADRRGSHVLVWTE